jgi:hypothetical protein
MSQVVADGIWRRFVLWRAAGKADRFLAKVVEQNTEVDAWRTEVDKLVNEGPEDRLLCGS